jgi:hypothetical protein
MSQDYDEEIVDDEQIMDDDAHEIQIVDGNTYIGLPIYEPTNGILFGCHVSAHSFYKYDNETVCEFLRDWSCSHLVSDADSPEIMKLVQTKTPGGFAVYSVILKTHWLRMVQRMWRRTLEDRKKVIYGRASPHNMYVRETTGAHLPKYRVMPGLRGCLRTLWQKNNIENPMVK